jgi:chorismate-pyruvate lyase
VHLVLEIQKGTHMLKQLEFVESGAGRGTRPEVSALERVLPVIGGTVTEVLERHLGEPLRATQLDQRTTVCAQPLPALALAVGELVLERRVLLRGATTSAPVLYAESLIALDRLDPRVRQGLLTTDKPIGRLIRENRLEIFRELLGSERAGNPHAAALFGLPLQTPLLSRIYRMSNGGQPVMQITEWFAC